MTAVITGAVLCLARSNAIRVDVVDAAQPDEAANHVGRQSVGSQPAVVHRHQPRQVTTRRVARQGDTRRVAAVFGDVVHGPRHGSRYLIGHLGVAGTSG
ncbi:MAG: hypothetical protein R2856_13955 [Caldilineaceae bacterium]